MSDSIQTSPNRAVSHYENFKHWYLIIDGKEFGYRSETKSVFGKLFHQQGPLLSSRLEFEDNEGGYRLG